METNNKNKIQELISIIEFSNDAIFSKDLNGIILYWNKGAEDLYKYKPEEIIGKNVDILLPADRKDEIKNILKKIENGEKVDHFETVRVKKDGTKVHISLTVSPIKDESGRIIGAASISRDITNQIEKNEELEKMNKIMIGRELKMSELKNEIDVLKKKIENK